MVRNIGKLINLTQAARLLQCSISTLRRRDREGTFPTRRNTRGYRVYTQSDVEELRALKVHIKPGRPPKARGEVSTPPKLRRKPESGRAEAQEERL
jgi:DNA-binding transcriptional MerR regulator